MRVTGLDLSLTATGIARVESGDGRELTTVDVVKPSMRGHERLDLIVGEVLKAVDGADLITVEGPSYGSKGDAAHQIAGLWWLVTHALWEVRSAPVAVITPGALKKYATGKGGAPKDAVLMAVARRFPQVELRDNNGADALVLAAMGARRLGCPIDDLPKTHLAAMDGVPWPERRAVPA